MSEVQSENNSSTVKILDVIPVQLVDDESYRSYRAVESSPRTKYYKQTYRRAWEQMPDFAGWLTGVENEPTRAFCIYCQKTLHAHRLSLLKHTCTIRHQKAAQLHQLKKVKPSQDAEGPEVNFGAAVNEIYNEEEDEDMDEYPEIILENRKDVQNDAFHEQADQEDEDKLEIEDVQVEQDIEATSSSCHSVPPISTQVTDAVRGCPISGLAISLYKLIRGKWTYINEGYTNHEGRFSKFLESSNFTAGRYKLHYDVDKYFESKKQNSLYPFIEIVFDCKELTSSYHIPLILSPNGYTTFKGTL